MPNSGSLLVCITRTLRDPRANYQPMYENSFGRRRFHRRSTNKVAFERGIRFEENSRKTGIRPNTPTLFWKLRRSRFWRTRSQLSRKTRVISLRRVLWVLEFLWNSTQSATTSTLRWKLQRLSLAGNSLELYIDWVYRGTRWNSRGKLTTCRCVEFFENRSSTWN